MGAKPSRDDAKEKQHIDEQFCLGASSLAGPCLRHNMRKRRFEADAGLRRGTTRSLCRKPPPSSQTRDCGSVVTEVAVATAAARCCLDESEKLQTNREILTRIWVRGLAPLSVGFWLLSWRRPSPIRGVLIPVGDETRVRTSAGAGHAAKRARIDCLSRFQRFFCPFIVLYAV